MFLMSTKVYSQISDKEAKSVFIYNFTRLIEWSHITNSSFTIAVYNDVALCSVLKDYCKEKLVNGKPINFMITEDKLKYEMSINNLKKRNLRYNTMLEKMSVK